MSPRLLLALLALGAICLAASCGWLGFYLAERFINHGGPKGSNAPRSPLEEVKRLRQGLKTHAAAGKSQSNPYDKVKNKDGGCVVPPLAPGASLGYASQLLTTGGDPEWLKRLAERSTEQEKKKEEL